MAILACICACAATPAFAGETFGNAALSLGELVGLRAPRLASADRAALQRMSEGRVAHGAPFDVTAETVTCRVSDVDIAAHECTLTFREGTITLQARAAHELDATLREAGMEPEGAAGSMITQAKRLECAIAPDEVAERAGGGAKCRWNEAP